MIMSDHGFTTFDRAVHVNAWLAHRGFLTLEGPPRDDSTLANLNWKETEAYALGLNGLYLNRKGREKHGIVENERQADALLANLREQLLAWRDPTNGEKVMTSVAEVHAAVQNRATAPDLILGYAPGYRASWQTGVGATPAEELEGNRDAWIGDHCIDPAFVPGVLFTNFAVAPASYSIRDLPAVIFQQFNISR